jgi:hypothetical protein
MKGRICWMKGVPSITGLVMSFTNRNGVEIDNRELSFEFFTSTFESLKLIPNFLPLAALRDSLVFSKNLLL